MTLGPPEDISDGCLFPAGRKVHLPSKRAGDGEPINILLTAVPGMPEMALFRPCASQSLPWYLGPLAVCSEVLPW